MQHIHYPIYNSSILLYLINHLQYFHIFTDISNWSYEYAFIVTTNNSAISHLYTFNVKVRSREYSVDHNIKVILFKCALHYAYVPLVPYYKKLCCTYYSYTISTVIVILNIVYCIMYTVYYTVYSLYCMCNMYSVYCIVYSVYCRVYSVYCIVYRIL